MKKLFLITLFLTFPALTLAATKPATPSATGVSKAVQSKIDDLKERLATKVAELRKSSPKAISGTITLISVSSMTVDAVQKAYKIELTDSIKVAQMIKGKRTALTTEDLEKNDNVTIFGDFDETLDILQANTIFIEAAKLPIRLHGTVGTIDKKNNSFTLKGMDEASYTIDVESTTKNNIWSRDKSIEKSGFSKIETGMFVTVVGLENAKEADRYSAIRILTMKIDANAASATPLPTPSEKAASPSATPKVTSAVKPKATPTGKVVATPKTTSAPKATPTPKP